jgi:hypothetical protein
MKSINKIGTALAVAGAFGLGLAAQSAQAFTPDSFGGVVVSPAFGALAPGGAAGTNYIAFGVDFTYGGVEGVFSDPPHAFGGVNGSGVVDLIAPVDGRIVVLGTLNQGVTNFLYAEAGYANDGTLLLSVFDTALSLIGTAPNGPPSGANGRTTFSISAPGIAYFSITNPGQDTFGVDEITLNTPVAAPVPEPETYAMMLAGLGLLGFAARRRKGRAV